MRALQLPTFLALALAASITSAQVAEVRTGTAALAGWSVDAPGVARHFEPSDLPPPVATEPEKSSGSPVKIVPRPDGALPKVPDGFSVQVFASGFKQPRTLRVAPNGDVFLSESGTGRVLMSRASARELPAKSEVF